MKKVLSCVIVLVMIFSMNGAAYAADRDDAIPMTMEEITDIYGEDVEVEFLDDYDLNIAGEAKATASKAIVVIPGVGGSVLRNSNGDACWIWLNRVSQIACNENGQSINTITAGTGDYGVIGLYKTLCTKLEDNFGDEYDVIFFPYDWRLSNASSAAKLAIAVNNSYDELILVAHSMGGLVASKYCANSATNRNKVDKLITLGTPYTGTPELIYVAETGDFNVFASIAAIGQGVVKDLVSNFHCTYQLAPTTRYGNNYGSYIKKGSTSYSGNAARTFYSTRPWAMMSSGSTKPMYSAATTFHSSLIISGTHIANGGLVDTYKIVGKNYDTKSIIKYDANGNYDDFEVTNAGDGTVPRYSASNTESVTAANQIYEVTSKHLDLIKNQDALNYVVDIINGTVSRSYAVSSEINEKGWLLGEDNKRIYISVGSDDFVNIYDGAGKLLSLDGDDVYNSDGELVGLVGIVGQGDLKYCLRNDSYRVETESDLNVSRILVEYQDNGYYEYSVAYEDIPVNAIELNISDYSEFAVTCEVKTENGIELQSDAETMVIEPTHIMDGNELAERNAY